MAVPKRKTSNSRRKMRRSHNALSSNTVSSCSNCGASKLPHRVCLSCGYYKGVEVIKGAQEA